MLPVIVFGSFSYAHGREPRFNHRHLVAAAAEAVATVDHGDIEAGHVRLGDGVNIACQVAGGCIDLAADGAAGGSDCLGLVGAHAFGEDTNAVVDMGSHPVAVADNIVVEDRQDFPALLLCIVGKDASAVEALLFSAQGRENQRCAELAFGKDPRGFHHSGDAGSVIVGAGRICGEIHHVGDATVEVALDDDDAVRVGRAALDSNSVGDDRWTRYARWCGDRVLHGDDFKAGAAIGAHLPELGLDPAAGGADAARVGHLIRQRMAGTEAHHLLNVAAEAGLADIDGDGGERGTNCRARLRRRRRLPVRCAPPKQKRG